MFKQAMIAAAALSAAVWTVPAQAANYVALGRLVCGSAGGQGLVITSSKNLTCTYTPASGGPKAVYAGKIQKFGLDVGQTGKSVMIWQVLARTGTGIPDEQAFVASYCRHADREPPRSLDAFIVFSLFRLASITAGVWRRGLDGNAADSRAGRSEIRDRYRGLAQMAWALAQQLAGG